MDDKPIMTDLDADDAAERDDARQRKNWVTRFAAIFGLASQGQGGGAPGSGIGGGGGF